MILDGRKVAEKIYQEIKETIKNRQLKIAVILVGSDPASITYTNIKKKREEELGIKSEIIKLPEDASQEEIEKEIWELNKNQEINGFLVQLPLPSKIDTPKIIKLIDPEKDIDGFGGNFPLQQLRQF